MDQRIADICPARSMCKQHEILCGTTCPWFIDIRYQAELSGIPKKFSKFTVDTLPNDTLYLNALKRFSATDIQRIKDGQGLYLQGGVGVGKTTVVSALAISYILHKTLEDIRQGNRTKQLVQFVNVPDLLDKIRQGFNDEETAENVNRIVANLKRCPLAIMDDIGAEKPSEWVREKLLQIITTRHDEELSTFFTSNLTINDLIEPLGSRLQSRIAGMTVPLTVTGKDRRKLL